MADSTLAEIRKKVRRLTRAVSESQLSTVDLDQYINTFVLYDIPEHLRLFTLRKTLTFYTQPFIDTYSTNTTTASDPLFNFKNKYITVHEPFYIAGFRAFYTESRDQFFGIYPKNNSIQQVGAGNSVTVTFTGTIPSAPFLRNNVTFSARSATNGGLALRDVPFDNQFGILVAPNLPVPPALPANNQINYITGAFIATFTAAPVSGSQVFAETVPYQPSRPEAVLYFNNEFNVRPVPNQVYPVQMEVYIRPTELLASNQSPDLEQWWQYIAYGAAKKVFEDRQDLESVALIMPEYKQQERLVLRRTIVQQTAERVATIYTESIGGGFGFGYFSGNGFGS